MQGMGLGLNVGMWEWGLDGDEQHGFWGWDGDGIQDSTEVAVETIMWLQ